MSAEKGKLFRSSLNGFNKDDVNRYILETDRKNREEKDSLTKEKEELCKQKDILLAEKEALSEKITELASRLSDMEALNDQLKAEHKTQEDTLQDITKRHDFYKLQTEAQNEALAKAKDEKALLNEKIALLTEDNHIKDTQLKETAEKYAADIETLRQAYETEIKQVKDASRIDDGVAYKLDMYDRISSQIGDILINANRNSDDIITAAKQEADNILKRTNTTAEENAKRMREGIAASTENAIAAIRSEFSGNIESCAKEIDTTLTEIRYETDRFLALLTQKQSEIGERLDFYRSGISDSVKNTLSAFDSECATLLQEQSEEE